MFFTENEQHSIYSPFTETHKSIQLHYDLIEKLFKVHLFKLII